MMPRDTSLSRDWKNNIVAQVPDTGWYIIDNLPREVNCVPVQISAGKLVIYPASAAVFLGEQLPKAPKYIQVSAYNLPVI